MMRLLSIDTSTWWGAAALLEGTPGSGVCRVVAERRIRVENSHAARMLPLVDETLAQAGWPRTCLDGFAAVRGPGSFTGIRVGLGLVGGWGLASRRPRVGIGSLEAMAEAFGPAADARMPLLEAGRGELYGALYDPASSPPREIVAPWRGSPGEVAAGVGEAAIAFGPGAETLAATLPQIPVGIDRSLVFEGLAAAAGRIAWLRLDAGAGDGGGMSPMYLRPADAELPR